jgi:hypothetical protein
VDVCTDRHKSRTGSETPTDYGYTVYDYKWVYGGSYLTIFVNILFECIPRARTRAKKDKIFRRDSHDKMGPIGAIDE